MTPEDYLKNGDVCIRKEIFAVVKSIAPMPDAFAVICDRDEITVVIDQSRVMAEYVIEIEKDWKMITFHMVLPMNLVGFLAKVTNALAKSNICVFAVSAYSTDHILVKERDIGKAIQVLKLLGCFVRHAEMTGSRWEHLRGANMRV